MLNFLVAVIILSCCFNANTASTAETIPFVVIGDYAPLVINGANREGAAYWVADLLTRRSSGRFLFDVNILPRKRLDMMLQEGKAVVVPFVGPQFFGDEGMHKYLWTSALFVDK